MKLLFKFIIIFLFFTGQICSVDLTKKETIQKVYQLMKDVNDVFAFHKIEYWADGTTLLGATRYNSLLPWVDSLDICIIKENENKFLITAPTFELLGYKMFKTIFGYRIFPNDGFSIDDDQKPWKYPFIDLYLMTESADKIYNPFYIQNSPRRDNERPFIKKNELFPLTKYIFGPLAIFGPNNPFIYLETWYGSNWYSAAHKTINQHRRQQFYQDNMALERFGPILPSNSLVNRFVVPEIKEVGLE